MKSDEKVEKSVTGQPGNVSRRNFVQTTGALGVLAGIESLLPDYALATGGRSPAASPRLQPLEPSSIVDGVATYDLRIAETALQIAGRRVTATTINGTIPGPLLNLQEGQQTVMRVTNALHEDTSIHWHGVLVPPGMDGVPGVSFPGIGPGQTFEYRFPLKQYGTYWYHSHSGLQEQLGHYGPLIIHPAGGYPYQFDREYVIVLSDWTNENPYTVLSKLKKQGNYYNFQRRTVGDFFADVKKYGWGPTWEDRKMWAKMRMDPTDMMDVTGATLTFLMNGMAPVSNWTGLFTPGERVLLRFINSGAAAQFDVRIPGLPMQVVQVSGQFVQPVETDEFRITNAETFDVIVQTKEDRAYTVFAEAMDRSGYASGTLAPRAGMRGAIPKRRQRPILTMSDMGMSHGDMADMPGMDMKGMPGMDATPAKPTTATSPAPAPAMAGHDMSTMSGAPAKDTVKSAHDMNRMSGMAGMSGMTSATAAGVDADAQRLAIAGATWTNGLRPPGTLPNMLNHEPSSHGAGNSAVPMMTGSRLSEAGSGLGNDGWRVLRYTDLRSLREREDFRPPEREIEMHLTGNMERFMWSIDGKTFAESEPIHFGYRERIRLTMVNDTMMGHPMHLHGMWMELENGHGNFIPRVHTVYVKPSERISLLITPEEPGSWAFHCHILYHMDVGMFRVVQVSDPNGSSMGEMHK